MKTKTKRPLIEMQQLLDWLESTHPDLHPAAEIDRAWLWLTANLQGDQHTATRESLKAKGFIFHRHGGHPLGSGKLGTWGHACQHPIKFKYRKPDQKSPREQVGRAVPCAPPKTPGGSKSNALLQTKIHTRIDPLSYQPPPQPDDTDTIALAFINA